MGTEKFCLRWNDFESNISVAFRELREEKDFFDVTLACDDSQIQAHKVILSACSPFFRNILRRNPHQHPLVYLKGVKYTELLSVLNFMYMGEVNVAQEELNSFLAVAEDLRVKGLTQNNSAVSSPSTKLFPKKEIPKQIIRPRDPLIEKDPVPPPPKRPRPQPAVVHQSYQAEEDDIQEVVPVKSEPRDPVPAPQPSSMITPPTPAVYHAQPIVQQTQEFDQGTIALDESYAAEESYDYGYEGYEDGSGMLDPNTGMPYADAGADKGFSFGTDASNDQINSLIIDMGHSEFHCSACGHVSKTKSNMQKHIDAKHIPSQPVFCQFCDKKCPSKNALQSHVSRYHKPSKANV